MSYLKQTSGGTSLGVHWLRLHAPKAGGAGLIPAWRTKIPNATWHGQKNKFFLRILNLCQYISMCVCLNFTCAKWSLAPRGRKNSLDNSPVTPAKSPSGDYCGGCAHTEADVSKGEVMPVYSFAPLLTALVSLRHLLGALKRQDSIKKRYISHRASQVMLVVKKARDRV